MRQRSWWLCSATDSINSTNKVFLCIRYSN